jgi:hypothetical protein
MPCNTEVRVIFYTLWDPVRRRVRVEFTPACAKQVSQALSEKNIRRIYRAGISFTLWLWLRPVLVWPFEKRSIGLTGTVQVLVRYGCMPVAIYYGYGAQPYYMCSTLSHIAHIAQYIRSDI